MLFFDTSDEVMKSRITERSKSSGRADDNPESVQNRI
jgi:adenylate kinase family enzyme